MLKARMPLGGVLIFLCSWALRTEVLKASPGGTSASSDQWELVKLAVARNSASSMGGARFFRSLRLWAQVTSVADEQRAGMVQLDANADEPISVDEKMLVHIKGDLTSALRVGTLAEVVIGGSVSSSGRIEAEGIATIHVQGDMSGVIDAGGMVAVWIEGSLRGEVRTGQPSTYVQVGRMLTGTIRPLGKAALLYVGVGGQASSASIGAMERQGYTELNVVAGSSDGASGIRRLADGGNGFVAILSPAASTR